MVFLFQNALKSNLASYCSAKVLVPELLAKTAGYAAADMPVHRHASRARVAATAAFGGGIP
jgi:hypothetical protein